MSDQRPVPQADGKPLRVDHFRAVTDRRYRNRIKRRMLETQRIRGVFRYLDVVHEDDGSCCKLEPWPTTAAHLWANALAGASGRDPGDVQALLAEHEPSIVLAGNVDAAKAPAPSANPLLSPGCCDFCGSTPSVTQFPTCDFALRPSGSDVAMALRGAWRACATCKELVDADADDELLERADSLLSPQASAGLSHGDRRGFIKALHSGFRAHRRRDP